MISETTGVASIPPINADAVPPGYHIESFRLDEGYCWMLMPQRLSPESLQDYKDHVALALRRLERNVVKPELPAPAPAESPTP